MSTLKQHIAGKLREFRKAAGMNVDQVGDALGVSGKTISAWEVMRGEPHGDDLIKLASLFDVQFADFYEGFAPLEEGDETPLYGRIAAGDAIEMDAIEDTFPVLHTMKQRYPNSFLLTVDGDSMNRILPNGCYALINPTGQVDHDGAPYAVCVNGYDATIKRVRRLNNGFELVPDSTDPTYQTKTYNFNDPGTETITIIGEVVWYTLPYDWSF